jgi:O-antigen ligase
LTQGEGLNNWRHRLGLWPQVWLSLLPLLPGLSVLVLPQAGGWRSLPPAALQVFALYAFAQQLAALFTPQPLLASLLALLRSTLILALLVLGQRIGSSRKFWPFLIGAALAGIIALFTSTELRTGGLLGSRLSHPYLTEVALGILGMLGGLISLFAPWRLWLRLFSAVFFLVLLLLSGSRGPLIMAGAAALTAAVIVLPRRRFWPVALATLVTGCLLLITAPRAVGFAARLLSADSTGRDVVWLNTLEIVQAYPTGGVGPYLFGSQLSAPVQVCDLWPALAEAGYRCPEWLTAAGQPWLIAHNGVLQQLGESGVIGTAGFFLLLGFIIHRTVKQRDVLAASLIAAILAGNFIDNTILLPSSFFAEIFWVAAGTQLGPRTSSSPVARDDLQRYIVPSAPPLLGGVLLLAMGFPLLAVFNASEGTGTLPTVQVEADQLIVPKAPYRVHVRVVGVGTYRLVLRSCTVTCHTLVQMPIDLAISPDVWLEGEVPFTDQRMNLLLLTGKAVPWRIQPLGETNWLIRAVSP